MTDHFRAGMPFGAFLLTVMMFALAAFLVGRATVRTATHSVPPVASTSPFHGIALCRGAEDHPVSPDRSQPCVWDASRLGNGRGTSFVYYANGGSEEDEVFISLDGSADCIGSVQSLGLAVELCEAGK